MGEAETYDYVIVGAGSAGCVLANRLSADGRSRVAVLEAGGSDRHPYIWAPAGFLKTFQNPRFNWCYSTEPSEGVDGRSIYFPRGRVLGGSSSINGHLYVRGQARDYDSWAQMGNRGWSYQDVLPYFRRSEDRSTGGDEYHGAGGPQHVSDIHERAPALRGVHRGGDGARAGAESRLQRREPGGRRLLSAHHPQRPSGQRRGQLPAPRHAPEEPAGDHPRHGLGP